MTGLRVPAVDNIRVCIWNRLHSLYIDDLDSMYRRCSSFFLLCCKILMSNKIYKGRLAVF